MIDKNKLLKLEPTSSWIIFDDNKKMQEINEDVKLPLTESDLEAISKMVSYIDSSYYQDHKKYKIKPGIGIAATQIGYSKKIIYIHLDEDETEHTLLLANPKIVSFSKNKSYVDGGEGCLSVAKDHKGLSIRYEKVVVEALDLFTDKTITINASGLLAICLQHEIDHTHNKFYYNRINPLDKFYKEKDWRKV